MKASARGLAIQMRGFIQKSLREATADLEVDIGRAMADDAERSATRTRGIFAGLLGSARSVGAGLVSAVSSGARMVLIGAAAGVALAGVSSLLTGVVGLIAALGQAAGVAGLLPAAFVLAKAAAATFQLGMQGVSETFKALASGDMAAFEEAVNKLAPEAEKAVRALAGFKPAFDRMQLGVQNALFDGLSTRVRTLAEKYLPLASQTATQMARSMNSAAREVLDFAASGDTVGRVSSLLGNVQVAFQQLMPAIKPVISAFLDVSNIGSSFLPGITEGIAGAALRLGDFIRSAADSGKLSAFFQAAIDTVKQLGAILGQVGGIFASVFQAATAAGGGFLGRVQEIATALNNFLKSTEGQNALTSFFTTMREIIGAVLPVLLTLVQVVAGELVPVFGDLALAILPAIQVLVEGFGGALDAARPGIQAFAQGVAALITAMGPVITIAVQLAGVLGGVLGEVLTTLAPVIARVSEALLGGLMKVMPQLEPVIIQIAEAVVDLIDAALPLIPVFFDLVAALLPLLPPLLDLVSAVLPPLIELVQALVPIIQAWADILVALLPPITAIVTTILDILIPPIKLVAEVMTLVAQITAAVITGMSGTITSVLTALGGFISGIWQSIYGVFSGAVSSISSFVLGGFRKIRETVVSAVTGLRDAVGSAIEGVIGFFRELPGKVLGFLGDIASKALQAGRDIVGGIVSGIGSMGSAIKDKLLGMVDAAWDSVLSFFGISSPSKLAIATFEEVGKGASIGLKNMIGPVAATAAELAAGAMSALNGGLGVGIDLGSLTVGGDGADLSTGGVRIDQRNIMLPGTDVLQFASVVNQRQMQTLTAGPGGLSVARGSTQFGMSSDETFAGLGV